MRQFLFMLLILLAIGPSAANAQFGSAVAVVDGQVLVMKPGGSLAGSASIDVFDWSGDSWVRSQRVYPAGAFETAQWMNASMAVSGNTLFAAAADASARLGAHVFSRDEDGWHPGEQVALAPHVSTRPESATLNDVMQILQPPARKLAASGDLLAISAPNGPVDVAGVHLFQQQNDAWVRDTTLTGYGNGFGTILAAVRNRVIVGSPSDSVHVFARDENGWQLEAVLKASGLSSSRITAALMDDDLAILGAPASDAAGIVLVFERAESGEWNETQRLPSPDGISGDAFGAVLAMVGDELWVAAPRSHEFRGAVYRFERNGAGDSFTPAGALEIEDLEPGGAFGFAIAGNGNTAVVGAPGADGLVGMAAIFTKTGEGDWQAAQWVRPAEPLVPISGEERRCEEGKASGFSCDNVDLLAFLPTSALGAEQREVVSDLWGWTDPLSGREYAMIGRTSGASIVDVTNPTMPAYIGLVPANPTFVRDLKVYHDHLFFTGDGAGDHGLVVFDLTRLRDVADQPTSFEPDTVYHGIASAHNLIIDTESGFAYAVGSSQGGETCGGGLHMIDIREPQSPVFAGCYTDTIGLFSEGRTHDAQCTIYRGPDESYAGRQICFASNETALRIVDVTDKSNPVPLAAARYPRTAYVHQGWLTEDHRYFYLDDELDELVGMTDRTRTMIWDVSELDDPILVGEITGNTTATDHNLYVKGDRMYQANYQGGLRIWDISDPEKPVEVGHFDTTTAEGNPPGFTGAWTAYPYFESGTIIVSSMQEGLFIVKPSEPVP